MWNAIHLPGRFPIESGGKDGGSEIHMTTVENDMRERPPTTSISEINPTTDFFKMSFCHILWNQEVSPLPDPTNFPFVSLSSLVFIENHRYGAVQTMVVLRSRVVWAKENEEGHTMVASRATTSLEPRSRYDGCLFISIPTELGSMGWSRSQNFMRGMRLFCSVWSATH
jgi:hypothetical protein